MKLKLLIVTISDRASKGIYEDLSGPVIEDVVAKGVPDAVVERKVVPDEKDALIKAFDEGLENDFIITTGSTGIGPRDIAPDVTGNYCDKLLPGIAEILRAKSYKETPNAMLSRAVAGIKGNTIIVNLPGSVKGAAFCCEILVPILPHAKKMILGEGH